MSNYRPMPSRELLDAIQWLRGRPAGISNEESQHRSVLQNDIQVLIAGYNRSYQWSCYQDFIRPRNELAQKLFTENYRADSGEGDWLETMQRCLAAADLFLDLSGEKAVKAEDIKERLREVLGWNA